MLVKFKDKKNGRDVLINTDQITIIRLMTDATATVWLSDGSHFEFPEGDARRLIAAMKVREV